MKKQVNVLETTLRDGSYAVNFTFSAGDTAVISRELEDCGFRLIEIGHGVGLDASRKGLGEALATDEEYMQAASEALTHAKYGMFCIPGIAELDSLHKAHDLNMGFVRVGTEISNIRESQPFIEKAKKFGMFVAANYMKSYAASPAEFAEGVKRSEEYGADLVYIVDSAGGMFASDIRRYFEAIRLVSDIPVGFHAHDNLGLSIANSLEAVQMGITYVDSSIQGLGRSAGNACSEILIAALKKLNYESGINLLSLLKLGPKYIQPRNSSRKVMPLDVVSGYSEFHSSYMPQILKCASKYAIDPAVLIIEYCKINKINLIKEELEELAKNITSSSTINEYGFSAYVGEEQR